MRIWLTHVFVEDQAKALEFYREVLGFVRKDDVSMGQYRWLTVVSPDDPDGARLLLEPNNNPAAKTFQTALREQKIPSAQFQVEGIEAEVARLKSRGAKLSQEITEFPGYKFAVLDDTCGNFIQIIQLG